ncbi:MAG TPA: pirin family protein [Parvularculaceae bacterium]|nr:pirin family protein [Parvularculaceae bacterium]
MPADLNDSPLAPAEADEVPPGGEIVIRRRRRDLGGFEVGRVLPFAKRRMVGPFIFLDEMGPATFAPGEGIDVRPHPHIGLATVTYLFDGEIRHRDNLGCDEIIRPGDVNWMTAGQGVVHSERTDAGLRTRGHRLHGLQSWVALPDDAETTEPDFHHHGKETLPAFDEGGARFTLIAGSAFGETSPVRIFSPMFYVHVEAPAGARIALPDAYAERALYLIEGRLSIGGTACEKERLVAFSKGSAPEITAQTPARLMLLGGEPIGERVIWWNFVASSEERIDAAKVDWSAAAKRGFENAAFSLPPGESEFIPLP